MQILTGSWPRRWILIKQQLRIIVLYFQFDINPKFVIIRTLFTLFVNMMNVVCIFVVIQYR